MPRPLNPDLNKPWKINLPATLAGRVEYALSDPIHQKPIYGARNLLISACLEWWIAREAGTPEHLRPEIPTLAKLRERVS